MANSPLIWKIGSPCVYARAERSRGERCVDGMMMASLRLLGDPRLRGRPWRRRADQSQGSKSWGPSWRFAGE
jgi:hypothetical protein